MRWGTSEGGWDEALKDEDEMRHIEEGSSWDEAQERGGGDEAQERGGGDEAQERGGGDEAQAREVEMRHWEMRMRWGI